MAAGSRATYRWTLDGSLYCIPRGEARVVVPLHRCHLGLASPDGAFASEGTDLTLTADQGSPAVRVTESAALIEGLGRVYIYGSGSTNQREIDWQSALDVRVDVTPAGSDRAAVAVGSLSPQAVREANQAGRWKL